MTGRVPDPVPTRPIIAPRPVAPAPQTEGPNPSRRAALGLAALRLAGCVGSAPAWAGPSQAAALPAPPDGFVSVRGRHFVGPDGRPFLIRGINLGNWLVPEGYMFKFDRAKSPREINAVIERVVGRASALRFWEAFRNNYIARDDIAFIQACGFNTIRVPLHWDLFVDPDDTSRFAGPGYALLDRVIAWAREVGLKVLIDMHAAPGGQTGVNHDDGSGIPLVFYVPAYRRLTIALWRELAHRYRDEAAVIGYDLLNEPISPYLDTDYLNPRLEPLYRDITAAIRSVDTRHIIFYAGAQWSTNFAVFGPPFARQVAYTYHKFWARPDRDEVQSYVNFSNRYDVPLLLGETGELTDEWNRKFRALNERFGISWSFWTYKNMDSRSTVVSITPPPGWQAIARVAAVPPAEWTDALVPPRAQAQATLDAYLQAMLFRHGHINAGYVESLGLRVPAPTAMRLIETETASR